MYDVRKEKFTNLYTHTHTNHAKHQRGLDLGGEGVPSTKGTFGAFLFLELMLQEYIYGLPDFFAHEAYC